MNTQQRMHYILNNKQIVQQYMNLHDAEVKMKKTMFQKFKEMLKVK
jgi:hypothetical protein